MHEREHGPPLAPESNYTPVIHAEAPIDTFLDRLAGRSCAPKRNGNGWAARCPAHDDQVPSLTVDVGDDGQVLAHCHAGAGCSIEAITSALDLTPRDLFPPDNRQARSRIVDTYDYVDEHGARLFQVVRFDPKDFRQRRPDPTGGWIWNLRDTRRVLYRLPALEAADEVYICEGEKDVHAAEAAGVTATTNPGGAGKWRPEYSKTLQAKIVFVVADADQPGRDHAFKVADSLHGIAAAVDVVEPIEGKDLADHLAAGHSIDDLRLLTTPPDTDDGPELEEPPAPPPPDDTVQDPDDDPGPVTHNRTDLGNARRLIAAHGTDLRYVPQWSRWLHWDGRRWAVDVTGHVQRRAKEVAEAIFTEAATIADSEDRKKMVAHALTSERRSRLDAMVAVATTEPGVPVEPHELDADPWLLTVANGTLDLRDGQLRDHDRADLITKASPVRYDPDATSTTWNQFLAVSTEHDPALSGFLQRAVGYSLTGDTGEEVLFFVHGPAASGKSTFFGAIEAALGDWARHADFETFLARQDAGGPRGDIARLAGARFVDSIEVDEGKKLAEGLIKTLTGGDTITAAFKYRDDFEFRAQFKLWLAANHAPRIRHGDEAMWRRILRVPFEHSVAKADRDPAVKAELTDPHRAGPAILAWAVEGCLEWRTRGLDVPDTVTRATDAYRAEMDPLGEFLEEYCRTDPTDPNLWVRAGELRAAYGEWCKENDIRRTLSPKAFQEVLREHDCEADRRRIDGKSTRIWTGIGLLDLIERDSRDARDARDATSEESSRGEGNTERSSEQPSRSTRASRPPTVTEPPLEAPTDDDWPGGKDPDDY